MNKLDSLNMEIEILKNIYFRNKTIKKINKHDLQNIIVNILKNNNNKGDIIYISKCIWKDYSESLKISGDIFYTWQYDFRWAATELRKKNIIKKSKDCKKGIWELV